MIDFVIWTLNSEKYLRQVLTRVIDVIPDKKLDSLILVDGGSVDDTKRIGRELGWKVYDSPKGISAQANIGLSHVKSEFFGSVEHDVLLADNWFSLIKHFDCPDVGVVQGIRLPTNPVLYAIDWNMIVYEKKPIDDVCISIDNHIYATDFMRKIGGFPSECPIAVDRALRDRVLAAKKRWVIDPKIQSAHIRESLLVALKHNYAYLSAITREDQLVSFVGIANTVFVPLRALRVAKHTLDPRVIPYLIANGLVRYAVYIRGRNKIKAAKKD